LPTPLSPVISTFASDGAIAEISSSISCIALLLKTGASRVSAWANFF
jgi:hypothetical protein